MQPFGSQYLSFARLKGAQVLQRHGHSPYENFLFKDLSVRPLQGDTDLIRPPAGEWSEGLHPLVGQADLEEIRLVQDERETGNVTPAGIQDAEARHANGGRNNWGFEL